MVKIYSWVAMDSLPKTKVKLEIPDLRYTTSNVLYFHDYKEQPRYWRVSERDIALIDWLIANVGKNETDLYRLPLIGNGWSITAGHEYDENVYDYHYRNFPNANYKPKGKFGFWLEIDEDNAVLVKLHDLLPVK